jgi:hypothetical protein
MVQNNWCNCGWLSWQKWTTVICSSCGIFQCQESVAFMMSLLSEFYHLRHCFHCVVGSSHLKEQSVNIKYCSFVKHISFEDFTSAWVSEKDAGLQVTWRFSWWLWECQWWYAPWATVNFDKWWKHQACAQCSVKTNEI